MSKISRKFIDKKCDLYSGKYGTFVFKSLSMYIAGCITFCGANTSQDRLLEILRFIKMELEKAARSTPDKFDATLS